MSSASRNMESSTSRVTTEYELKMALILTTRVSYVHEQYHLIHFRHLQIYCSSPTTSANKLDVGLQPVVPSYDAQYFVYERGGEARNNFTRTKSA